MLKKLLSKNQQLVFFVIAGGLSAVIEIGFMKILSLYLPLLFSKETNFYGVAYPFSNIFSTSGGIISNYFFSIWFVFERGKHSKRREFIFFIGVSVVATFVSLFLFNLLFHYIFLNNFTLFHFTLGPIMMSKIIAIALVSLLSYGVKKKIVFNG